MKKETTNTFSGGLNYDLNAIVTPNNVLTDAVNCSMITFNGDELALQNDAGNTKILVPKANPNDPDKYVQLSEGFYPLGIKEEGGILYIVSGKTPNNELFKSGKYYTLGSFVFDTNNVYYKNLTAGIYPLSGLTDTNWEVIGTWNDFANKYGEIEFGSYPSPKNAELGITKTKSIDLDPNSNYILGNIISIIDTKLNSNSWISFNYNNKIDISNVSFQDYNGTNYTKIYKVKLWQVIGSEKIDLTSKIEEEYKNFRLTQNNSSNQTTLQQSIDTTNNIKELLVASTLGFPNSGFVTINITNLNGDSTYVFRYTKKEDTKFINEDIPTDINKTDNSEYYFNFNSISGVVINQLANYWFADPTFRYHLENNQGFLVISLELENISCTLDSGFESSMSINMTDISFNEIIIENNPNFTNSGTLIMANSLIKFPYINNSVGDLPGTSKLELLNYFNLNKSFFKGETVYIDPDVFPGYNFYLYNDINLTGEITIIWPVTHDYPADKEKGTLLIKGSRNGEVSAIDELLEYDSIKRIGNTQLYTVKYSNKDKQFLNKHLSWTWSLVAQPDSILEANLGKESNVNGPAAITFPIMSKLAENISTKRYMEMTVYTSNPNLIEFTNLSLNLKSGLNYNYNYDFNLRGTDKNVWLFQQSNINYINQPINYTIKPTIKFLRTNISEEIEIEGSEFPEDINNKIIITGNFSLPQESMSKTNYYYLIPDRYVIKTTDGIESIIYYQSYIKRIQNETDFFVDPENSDNLTRKWVIMMKSSDDSDYESSREYGTSILCKISKSGSTWVISEETEDDKSMLSALSSEVKNQIEALIADSNLIFTSSISSGVMENNVLLNISIPSEMYSTYYKSDLSIIVKQNNQILENINTQNSATLYSYNVLKATSENTNWINIEITKSGFEPISYNTNISVETSLTFGLIASIEAITDFTPSTKYWTFKFNYEQSNININNLIHFTTDAVSGISGGSNDIGKNVYLNWDDYNKLYTSSNPAIDTVYSAISLIPQNLPNLSGTYSNISSNNNYFQCVNTDGIKVIFKKLYTFII